MRLVTEKVSEIRERGDKVAHQTPPARSIYTGALTRAESEGMQLQILFVYIHWVEKDKFDMWVGDASEGHGGDYEGCGYVEGTQSL